MKKKIQAKEIGETLFIILYLLFMIIACIIFITKKNYYILIMTLLLMIGDSFHLIPRIIKNLKGNFNKSEFYLGLGTQISSITMSGFYLLFILSFDLYFTHSFNFTNFFSTFSIIIIEIMNYLSDFGFGMVTIILLIIRVILCLLPQNNWYKSEGNKTMAIIRNIPFVLLGLIAVLFSFDYEQFYLGILVILSFLFYLPVALFGKTYSKLGMLMIPKTICYILMISYFL